METKTTREWEMGWGGKKEKWVAQIDKEKQRRIQSLIEI